MSEQTPSGQTVTLSKEQFDELLREARKTREAATSIGQIIGGLVLMAIGLGVLSLFGLPVLAVLLGAITGSH